MQHGKLTLLFPNHRWLSCLSLAVSSDDSVGTLFSCMLIFLLFKLTFPPPLKRVLPHSCNAWGGVGEEGAKTGNTELLAAWIQKLSCQQEKPRSRQWSLCSLHYNSAFYGAFNITYMWRLWALVGFKGCTRLLPPFQNDKQKETCPWGENRGKT